MQLVDAGPTAGTYAEPAATWSPRRGWTRGRDPRMVAGSGVPITGVARRPVSPCADTEPFVSRFSGHIAIELVTVGPVSAAAGLTL